jgi:hypothetical protein
MDFQIPFTMRGFPDEPAAIAASQRVTEVIQEIACQLGLSLTGLDGVTIAYDYDSALSELDRGFPASHPLTRTADEIAIGIAMAPLVKRDGKVRSHIVLSAAILPLIEAMDSDISGKYIIAHELAHSHEHYFRDNQIPGMLLQQQIFGADEIFLYDTADACWSEYAACYFSAPAGPEHVKLLEKTFVAALRGFSESIIQAKREWMEDKNFDKVWDRVTVIVARLLKSASSVMGHTVGLDKPFDEVANIASLLMQENSWLFRRFEELYAALGKMMDTFERWTGPVAFDPLKQVVRDVVQDCGITMQQTINGSLYIVVGDGKLPVSSQV